MCLFLFYTADIDDDGARNDDENDDDGNDDDDDDNNQVLGPISWSNLEANDSGQCNDAALDTELKGGWS